MKNKQAGKTNLVEGVERMKMINWWELKIPGEAL